MVSRDPFPKLTPGDYFHIYNRGNNKEVIFKTHENYLYFLNLWKKYIQPVAETICYNLLHNHFHFFVRIRETDLTGFENLLGLKDMNPVVVGFVIKPEDWKYSSARNFCGLKGLIDLKYSS
jgi:hypothetical protein